MKWKRELAFTVHQTRKSRGKLLFSVLAVLLGVAATTAVRTFSNSLSRAVTEESRDLMGGDLRLESGKPIGPDDPLARSLQSVGTSAGVTEFYTMLVAVHPRPEANLTTKLVRVRAISGPYPFYGRITTTPAEGFSEVKAGKLPVIAVDPTLVSALGLKQGDIVAVGSEKFRVAGSLNREPGSPVFSAGYGAPVYIHEKFLEKTGLLVTGSRIRFARYFKLPRGFDVESWKDEHWKDAQERNITIYTYREAVASVRRFMENLSRFLTLAGLVILFLGGLGIGLAMNVFVKSRLDDIAVARALGATPGFTMRVYLMLGFALAFTGTVAGSVIGYVAAKFAAGLGAGYLPVRIEIFFDPATLLYSAMPGILVTLAFVLFPVFRTRKISPLRVLRRNTEPTAISGTVFARLRSFFSQNAIETGAFLLLIGVLVFVSITQSDSAPTGVFFTFGVLAAAGLLFVVSRALIRLVRKLIPRVRQYRIRQGLANLYRPGNQTSTMLVATGVGVLLIMAIFTIQTAIQGEISFQSRARPNVFLMDVQEEQKEGALRIMDRYSSESALTPMISMRIRAINGEKIDRSNIEKNANRRNWENSLRSYEYFGTYKQNPSSSEKLIKGSF